MTEEDLELLITLDDPVEAREEDIFTHLQANNLKYWLGQPRTERLDIEVFTVTHWKNGQIVSRRCFMTRPECKSRLGSFKHLALQEDYSNEMLFAFI
jgi:hypothetical protein